MWELGQLMQFWGTLAVVIVLAYIGQCNGETEDQSGSQKYKIEGKVIVPFTADQDWITTSRILVDGGELLGFLRYVLR